MKIILNELLDSVYELEGLIQLALNREDTPQHLVRLIARKGEVVAQNAAELTRVKTDTDDFKKEVAAEDEMKVDDIPVLSIAATAPLTDEADDEGVYDVATEDVEEEVKESEGLPAQVEDEVDESPVEEEAEIADVADDIALQEVPSPDVLVEISDEIAGAEQTALEEIVHDIAEESLKPEPPVVPRGRLVFTLNDRFRFKRELFANSDADFNAALADVAQFDSFEEAENYFLEDYGWNPEKEEVKEFFKVLKNYYN